MDATKRIGALCALFLCLAAGRAEGQALRSIASTPGTPAILFHVGSSELVGSAYPEATLSDLEDDVEWTRNHADPLLDWWARQGTLYLQRLSDFSGLAWHYREVPVHLVRFWPTVSIEYPLVLALDEVRAGQQAVAVPEDEDVRVLLLAHQVAHYLLDDPLFVPRERRSAAYQHPFLDEGNFAVEAMVNWVVYATFEELWGANRLREATDDPLWRAYNPNHEYVVDELMPRARLARTRTLVQWLAQNPEGSEIFRVREAHARQAGTPEAAAPQPQETTTGTDYGLDLGATFEGRILVSYVDRGSPAERVGLQQGDVVLTIEGRDAGRNVADAQRRMAESWEQDEEIDLSVEREGEEIFATIHRR